MRQKALKLRDEMNIIIKKLNSSVSASTFSSLNTSDDASFSPKNTDSNSSKVNDSEDSNSIEIINMYPQKTLKIMALEKPKENKKKVSASTSAETSDSQEKNSAAETITNSITTTHLPVFPSTTVNNFKKDL